MQPEDLIEIIEAGQLSREPSVRLEYALSTSSALRRAFSQLSLHNRFMIEWDMQNAGRSSIGTAFLAFFFPIHYFMLGKKGCGLAYWASAVGAYLTFPWGADVLATISKLVDKVGDPIAFLEACAQPEHRFLLLGVLALVLWAFGLAYVSRWTHEHNAGIVERGVALMRMGDQLVDSKHEGDPQGKEPDVGDEPPVSDDVPSG